MCPIVVDRPSCSAPLVSSNSQYICARTMVHYSRGDTLPFDYFRRFRVQVQNAYSRNLSDYPIGLWYNMEFGYLE